MGNYIFVSYIMADMRRSMALSPARPSLKNRPHFQSWANCAENIVLICCNMLHDVIK